LGNNQDNFQLRRFTTSENIARRFRGELFLTHTVFLPVVLCELDSLHGFQTFDPLGD